MIGEVGANEGSVLGVQVKRGVLVGNLLKRFAHDVKQALWVCLDFVAHDLAREFDRQIEQFAAAVQESLRETPALSQQEMARAWLESLRVERSAVMSLFHDNVINAETMAMLTAEIDRQLIDPAATWPEIQATIAPEGMDTPDPGRDPEQRES